MSLTPAQLQTLKTNLAANTATVLIDVGGTPTANSVGGNLNALTSGSVDVWMCLALPPA